jgi:hypothetical protein
MFRKVLAWLAGSAVQSRPTRMAMVAVPQPHEQNVAIERRLGPAVWLILSSPPIEHGRSSKRSVL